jgi:hypothetical protein
MSLTVALLGSLATAHADDFEPFSSEPFASEPFSFVPTSLEPIVRAQDTGTDDSGDAPAVADISQAEIDYYTTPARWFDFPRYGTYFQADALWLARTHEVSRPLVVTLPPGSQTVLSSQDASLSHFQLGCSSRSAFDSTRFRR